MKRKIAIIVTVMLFLVTAGCAVTEVRPDRLIEGLDFPVRDVAYLEKFHCFGLKPWDSAGNNEIHGGIDLVATDRPITTGIGRVPIIAPADARVERIVEGVSGAGVGTLVVVLKMNEYWYIAFSFEPQTINPAIFEEQRRSIVVEEKQTVERGELIGELVIGSVKPSSVPHLHFGFFYKNPDDTLDDIFKHYLRMRRSNGKCLAPITGKGSPWEPEDLERETTFFCPYEYSTPRAKAAYDSLPRISPRTGDTCHCICAYGSSDNDCGTCR